MKWIKSFKDIHMSDIAEAGGKNASLGELINSLSSKGINVPEGFAVTAAAFRYFIEFNKLTAQISATIERLNPDYNNLQAISEELRNIVMAAAFPPDLSAEILAAYNDFCGEEWTEVAVRSSATAEDLPNASFAGQHESFLNIWGDNQLLNAVKRCFASLYTARAIKYRQDQGFKHSEVAISVGIQQMVRADKGCSGVMFTLEPESGFNNIIHIAGTWGLGENLVQGNINPDEYFVFKPTLRQKKNAIIQRKLGGKELTMEYGTGGAENSIINLTTPETKRKQYVLTDEEVIQLANWALMIEEHYQKPMDIEWAKDGLTNKLFILQARPETVHARKPKNILEEYSLKNRKPEIVKGQAIGSKIAVGRARILQSINEAHLLEAGDIIVTKSTSPDWDPILKKALAIVTDEGGRTSHAAIVARELGVPAIVGTINGTKLIRDGQLITVSCCEGTRGYIYDGEVNFGKTAYDFSTIQMPESTDVMMIVSDPENAFKLAAYPNHGVGLLRIEFMITHMVKVHPMALIETNKIADAATKNEVLKLTAGYHDPQQYFVDQLAQGIATMAAAFYPKDVIVRTSDFKSNEYASLIGGKYFEPKEENPMIGLRGASRYYSPLYEAAFGLECNAIKKVRNDMGLSNVKIMIPFCRTVKEAIKVVDVMSSFGLDRKADDSLDIYMMVEIPSNVLLADEFAEIFDGFSIGSNDLTQLTLGIDRDSALVSELFDEQDKAAEIMISAAIKKAKRKGIKIGICGQAPSDYPEFAQFLVSRGIDSISFNPDAMIKGIQNIYEAEQFIKKERV